MAIEIRPARVQLPGRAVSSARTSRKIAFLGSHAASLVDCPWDDPQWELWGHATGWKSYHRQLDRYFDLHPRVMWTRGGKKGAQYPDWLKRQTVPIYMQEHYKDVPASVEYPRRRILMQHSYSHGRKYFTNHVAWMAALALEEGVTTVGLFGVDYIIESEYINQRACVEYWIGQLDARGVQVILPEQCTHLARPPALYGYQSHNEETGKLQNGYEVQHWTKKPTPLQAGQAGFGQAVPTDDIKRQIEAEEAEYPRPAGLLGPLEIEASPQTVLTQISPREFEAIAGNGNGAHALGEF